MHGQVFLTAGVLWKGDKMEIASAIHSDAEMKLSLAQEKDAISSGNAGKISRIIVTSKILSDEITEDSKKLENAVPDAGQLAVDLATKEETLMDKLDTIAELIHFYISDEVLHSDSVPAEEMFTEMRKKIDEDIEEGRVKPNAADHIKSHLDHSETVHDLFSEQGWTPFSQSLYKWRLDSMDDMYEKFRNTGDDQMQKLTVDLLGEMREFGDLGKSFEDTNDPDIKAIEGMYKNIEMQARSGPKKNSVVQKLRRDLRGMTEAKTSSLEKYLHYKKDGKNKREYQSEKATEISKYGNKLPQAEIDGVRNSLNFMPKTAVSEGVGDVIPENTENLPQLLI
jgi:hypothetical protein